MLLLFKAPIFLSVFLSVRHAFLHPVIFVLHHVPRLSHKHRQNSHLIAVNFSKIFLLSSHVGHFIFADVPENAAAMNLVFWKNPLTSSIKTSSPKKLSKGEFIGPESIGLNVLDELSVTSSSPLYPKFIHSPIKYNINLGSIDSCRCFPASTGYCNIPSACLVWAA